MLTGTYESKFTRLQKGEEGYEPNLGQDESPNKTHEDDNTAVKVVAISFPYSVYDEQTQDNETMQLVADVTYARNISVHVWPMASPSLSSFLSAAQSIVLLNGIRASAIYNRSLTNHSIIHEESGNSTEHFAVTSSSPSIQTSDLCYRNQLTASLGAIVNETEDPGACQFDEWFRLTGRLALWSMLQPAANVVTIPSTSPNIRMHRR